MKCHIDPSYGKCEMCHKEGLVTFEKYENQEGYDEELWICENCKRAIGKEQK